MSSKQKALVENVRGMIDKGERGAINAPRTEEFVVNSRGSRLHVRSDWTKAVQSLGGIREEDQGQEKHHLLSKDAIVVLLHGMGGHTNRPSFVHAASHYRALGYKVVAFDFHGHGYSDRFMPAGPNYDAEDAKKNRAPGEVDPVEEFGSSRCLIERWEHLLDDLTCVLRALYSDGDKEEPAGVTSKVPEHKLFLHATQDTPFFLMGTSMGGAIALLMGSILQKMVKSNGQGLCGGALPGAHCDEDFLEKYGNGADGGLKKSCLTPTLQYTEQAADVLLRPFFLAPSSFLIAATKDLALRASSVFTTPVSENSLLVGDEEDATVPGSRPNMEAAASVEDGLTDISTETDIDAGIGTEGAAPGATSFTGVPGDFDHSPEEEVGLPFLDASLLPIARASAGVVLMSPAISVNAPHPLLRATLDMMVAPLFPSAQMPDLLRKSIDDSASWKDPHYRDYATHDAFPRGLSYGQNMRLRTAATMLTLLDAVALEIPHMEAPFLCLMDPADAVVSVEGVRVLMQRCGESHRMYRDDVDAVPVDVDVAAYEIAASATAEQPPVPPNADSEAETASVAGNGAGEGEIPRSNAYGTFVPIAGGGHDCLANRMDECFDATATFFEKRLAAKSLEHPGLGAAGGVEL